MKTLEQKKQEYLSIADPRQALIKIATDKELKLDEMEQILMAYQEKHGVDIYEMGLYPNGERVLTEEMFWENEEE